MPDPSRAPDRPSPRPASVARLVAGVVVAGLGAALLAGGLVSIPRPAPSPVPTSPGVLTPTLAPATLAPASPASGSPAPVPAGNPVLVGAGDIARCDADDDEATARLIDGIAGTVFTLGDTAYEDGSESQLRDCYGPTWGRFLDRTRFVVTGNHDIRTDEGAPLRAYFGEAAARDGVTWFSEDIGAWHVIVLDSNCASADGGCGPETPQLRWLREDLAASTARCTLALWHHPRFSSGEHGSDPVVAPFWDALHAAGADLVLNGHDHDYERFAPQDAAGRVDRTGGLTEVVVGTGGAPLRGFRETVATSVVRASVAHGVLALVLEPRGWQFRFVSTDGSFSDQGRGDCH